MNDIEHDKVLTVASWFSPSVEVRKSAIAGEGLYAISDIHKDEVISIKDGHFVSNEDFNELPEACRHAALQITETMYIAPIYLYEIPKVMTYINHSCEPNVGLKGQILTVAMRDIKSGEELTGDYCIAYSNEFFEFQCNCGTKSCRGMITSQDWQKTELQKKYEGYFCQYLQDKIKNI